ncbi:MAG: type VI secretion lipoprotein TssJ [Candidatus Eisenbacteria bacterium]|nr:type VI secretion lipoprotein TssJ [Candidatus Eisenbacteria bacterium]
MRRSIRRFIVAVAALSALFAVVQGCAGIKKGSPTVQVTLTGAPDCNNCGGGTPSTVKFRIFQVADTGAVRTMLNKGLPWAKHVEAAGPNIVMNVGEDFVSPGISKTKSTQRAPNATAIVVEGNFCKKVGASWYTIHPFAKKGPLLITAGSTGLTVTSGK